jgi:hypothetical protein
MNLTPSGVDMGGLINGGAQTTLEGGSRGGTDVIEGGSMLMETDEPWIQIGTGFRQFDSLEPSQRVPIIAGIQGGFHVWGAFRAGGFLGENVTVLFKLYLEEQYLAEANYFEYFLPINSDGLLEYTGVSVIYFNNDDVDPTSGQEMRLILEVTNEEGITLNDEITIIPECCE